jgi:hypothetical protein
VNVAVIGEILNEVWSYATKVDNRTLILQLVTAIVSPDAQVAGENLQQIARTAMDRLQETANEFRNSLHSTTQNQHSH